MPAGDATVETFTIAHTPGGDVTIVRGRLADGRTFIANPGDPETAAMFESEDAFGAKVRAAPGEHGNVVHLVG